MSYGGEWKTPPSPGATPAKKPGANRVKNPYSKSPYIRTLNFEGRLPLVIIS